jgi:hypothetical protein
VILGLLSHFFDIMAHIILDTVTKSMDWLRRDIDASTYASSMASEGTLSAMDASVAPNRMLLRPLSTRVIEAIWETKILTLGIVLGLVLVFAVGYIRSPCHRT